MTEEDRKVMREEIISAVRETVSDRFDPLSPAFALQGIQDKLEVVDTHMKDMKPILDAYHGGKIIGTALKWLASVAIAWLVIKMAIHGIIHF